MAAEIVELQVSGMDCNNCAASIQRYLERKGLEEVFVNFQTSEVRFARNDAALDIEAAKAGIEKLGYQVVSSSEGKASAKLSASYRLLFCAFLTAPLLLGHLLMVFGFHWSGMENRWVQLALAGPVYLVGGLYFGRSAWSGLRTGYLNMDVLIFLGATAAFAYSMVGFFWQDPQYFFFETAATIITLVLIGNWLEERAVKGTTTALGALASLQVEKAHRIGASGTLVQIAVDELRKGDRIRVNTGDRVPLDARIEQGEVSVDESMLTGESLPVDRYTGEDLIGGSVVLSGQADMTVIATRKQGMLAQMIELVKTAQADKPKMQRIADRISAVFVPVVIGISILTFLLGWCSGYFSATQALMNAIAVLLISCPCAMGLATPTAVMVGVGRLARQGIMVKGGQAVEDLASIRRMVFDKTGTLTTGKFTVQQLDFLSDYFFLVAGQPTEVSLVGTEAGGREMAHAGAMPSTKRAVFSAPMAKSVPISPAAIRAIIYKMEGFSSHPIAAAISSYLEGQEKTDTDYSQRLVVKEQPGMGLMAHDPEQPGLGFYLGSARLLPADHPALEKAQVFLTDLSGHPLAALSLDDDIKAGAADLIQTLNGLGITTQLLSGDRQERVATLASTLGIASYEAEKLPAEKLAILSHWSQTEPTAMVGDGINDAAALARATIGISLGGASAAAVDAARIVLLRDRLPALGEAVKIARLTLKTIKESLFWAFSYNVVAIPLAALGFLNPMWAALFMAFSDIVVIGNAVRLRFRG